MRICDEAGTRRGFLPARSSRAPVTARSACQLAGGLFKTFRLCVHTKKICPEMTKRMLTVTSTQSIPTVESLPVKMLRRKISGQLRHPICAPRVVLRLFPQATSPRVPSPLSRFHIFSLPRRRRRRVHLARVHLPRRPAPRRPSRARRRHEPNAGGGHRRVGPSHPAFRLPETTQHRRRAILRASEGR